MHASHLCSVVVSHFNLPASPHCNQTHDSCTALGHPTRRQLWTIDHSLKYNIDSHLFMKHEIRRIRRIFCHSANSPNFMLFGEFAEFLRSPLVQSCSQCGKFPEIGSFFGSTWYAIITNLSLNPCECCDFGACWGHWKKHMEGNDNNHNAQTPFVCQFCDDGCSTIP